MKPGTRAVLRFLEANPDGITPVDALVHVGSFRLGARIWELRRDGYSIVSTIERTPSGKHISRYRLEKAA